MLMLGAAMFLGARSPPIISAIHPTAGSKAGGTMITLEGSGFKQGGEVGDTVVYIGPTLCTEPSDGYFSTDSRFICKTSPIHDMRKEVNARIVMRQYSMDGATSALEDWDSDCDAAGGDNACFYQYDQDLTPMVFRSSPAITAGGSLPTQGYAFGGKLRGKYADQYDIRMGPDNGECLIRNPYKDSDEGEDDTGDHTLDRSDTRRAERHRRMGDPTGFPSDDGDVPEAEDAGDEPRQVMDKPWRDVTEFCAPPPGLVAQRTNVTITVTAPEDEDPSIGFGAAEWLELSVERKDHYGKYFSGPDFNLVRYLYEEGAEAHTLTVLAEVTSVSPARSGSNGGHTITVSGFGFSSLCTENSIFLDGASCEVTQCSNTEIQCIAAPMDAENRGSPRGGAGLIVTQRKVSNPAEIIRTGTNIAGATGVTLGLRHGQESDLNSGDRYTSTAQGYFVAPEDNQYRFSIQVDDSGSLEIGVDSQTATPGSPVTLDLKAGDRVPLLMQHTEGNGLDYMVASVDLLNLPAGGKLDSYSGNQYHRVNEVQRISMSAPFRRQKDEVNITLPMGAGSINGKCRFGSAGRAPSSWLSMNGQSAGNSTDEIAKATASAFNGCGEFGVTRTFIPEVPADGDTAGTPASYILNFLYKCNLPISNGVATPFDDLTAECQASDWTTEVSRVQEAEEPVRGTVLVGINGVVGAGDASKVQWGRNEALKDALMALPGLMGVEVFELEWSPFDSEPSQNKWEVEVRFTAPGGFNFDAITVDTQMLKPSTVVTTVTTIQDGEPDTRRLSPIPVEYLEVATGPSAVAQSNGLIAACTDDDNTCAFDYSSSWTPEVTSIGGVQEITAGSLVEITGTGLVVDGKLPVVTFGGAECIVEESTATATQMTCTVGHTQAGEWPIVVISPEVGKANVAAGVQSVVYKGFVDAPNSGQWESGFRGGSPLELTGTGFSTIPTENMITVGGIACPVTSATHTSLICTVPAQAAATGTAYAALPDEVFESVAVAAFNDFGTQPSQQFSYRKMLTPSALVISPTELSAARTTTVEVEFATGTSTGFPLTGCESGVSLVAPTAGERECTMPSFSTEEDEEDIVGCVMNRGLPFPAAEQPMTFVRVTLCATRSDGTIVPVIAHPEPSYEHIDLALRVTSVTPSLCSTEGGCTLDIVGKGFADETDKIVRSALTYNYLEPMMAVNIRLADRTVPCAVIESDFSGVKCISEGINSANAVVTTEDGLKFQLEGGADGVVQVLTNDFEAVGCGDGGVPSVSTATLDMTSPIKVLSGSETVDFSGGGTATLVWEPVADQLTTIEFTLKVNYASSMGFHPWNSYTMLEVLNPAYPDGGKSDAVVCTANTIVDSYVTGLDTAPMQDNNTAPEPPIGYPGVVRAQMGQLSCTFRRNVAAGSDGPDMDYPLATSEDTDFQIAVGPLSADGEPQPAPGVYKHRFKVMVYGPSSHKIAYGGVGQGGACEVDMADSVTPMVDGMQLQGTSSFNTELSALGAQTLVFQGSGFGTNVANVAVTLGENICEVTGVTDTSVVCSLPAITAGQYRVVLTVAPVGTAKGTLLYTSVLSTSEVNPSDPSSTMGGLVARIVGTGFNSRTLDANRVQVCGKSATVLSASSTEILFVTPIPATKVEAPRGCDVVVNVTAELGGSEHGVISEVTTAAAAVTYSPTATPTVTSVSPAAGKEGDVLVISGSGLTGCNDVWIGGESCTDVSVLSDSSVQCTLGKTPGGDWTVYVTIPNQGVAKGDVKFESQINVNLPGWARQGGYGGNAAFAIEGYGLGGGAGQSRRRRAFTWQGHNYGIADEVAPEYGTHVSICGKQCTVTGSDYNTVSFQTPRLMSISLLQQLETDDALPEMEALTGTPIADVTDGGSEAFDKTYGLDNAYSSGSAGCYVGLNFGESVLVTRARYYPKHQNSGAMDGGKFEVTADPNCATGWTELANTDGATQGWNTAVISDPIGSGTITYCARYTRPSGSCMVTELDFRGYSVVPEGGCPVVVVPTDPAPHPSQGVLENEHQESGTSFSTQDYTPSNTKTAVVHSVSPKFGPSVGAGINVTVVGERFPEQGQTLVLLNGIECTILTWSETVITCQTGERGARTKDIKIGVDVCGSQDGCSFSNPSVRFRYLDRWSSPSSWLNDNIPLVGDTVVIPGDQTLLLDVPSISLNLFLIEGSIVLDRSLPNINIDAEKILVHGGLFEVGTADEPWPWDHTVTITLHGDRKKSIHAPFFGTKVLAVADFGGLSHSGHSSADEMPESQKGTLSIHGEPRVRTWTRLETKVGGWTAGETVVRTRDLVDFRAGEIVVVTAPQEKAEVSSLTCSPGRDCTCPDGFTGPCGDVITLAAPLRKTHLSSEMSSTDIHGNQFDVDMRCEIALLSRNVKIMGAGEPRLDGSATIGEGTPYPDEDSSKSQKFGCHTMAVHGGYYQMANAMIQNCGQAGVLGRYSTHLHVTGVNTAPKTYIHGNSMVESFQRAVTVHSTDHSSVKDNVAYKVMGHTFFIEFGDERFNVMDNNLGIATLPSFLMLKSDTSPATFWTANPTNIWRNNVATDSSARGMWFELMDQGPTIEHFNNSFHNNKGIGFRNYPNYSPPSPQYFYENTYHNNGGNGLFYKKGGDNHHAFSKFVSNGVDIFWKKYSTHNVPHTAPAQAPWNGEEFTTSRWIPNVRDCYFWGSYSEKPSPRGSQALFLPQAEYFYVDGATFDGYKDAGVISGCNGCCGTTSPKQGGFTFRFSRLDFRDSEVRTRWTCPYKQIFLDLDSTLTGYTGGTALPFYKYNEWENECVADATGAYSGGSWPSGGMVCNDKVRVRRLQIDHQEPRELVDKSFSIKKSESGSGPSKAVSGITDTFGDVNLTKFEQSGLLYNTECKKGNGVKDHPKWDFSGCDEMDYLDWVNYRRPSGEPHGWVAPVVTNHEYYGDWDWHIDFQQFQLRWSRPYYLEDPGNLPLDETFFPNEESVLMKFPYIDYRYQIPTFYAGNEDWPLPYAAVDPATGESGGWLNGVPDSPSTPQRYMTRHDSFGSGIIFRNDSTLRTTGTGGVWSVSLNPMNMTDIKPQWRNAQSEYNEYYFKAVAQQCAPNMCSLPGDREITIGPLAWSDPNTWKIAGLEFNKYGTQKGLEAQLFYDAVAAETQSVPAVGDSVEIPDGVWIVIDIAPIELDKLVVTGKLTVDWSGLSDMTLEVDRMLIFGEFTIDDGNGGAVPADKSADVVLHGIRTSPTLVATEDHFLGNKVIANFGEMNLRGAPVATKWTRLTQTADVNTNSIEVAAANGWQVGDIVVIAPTEYPNPMDIYAADSQVDSINDYTPHEGEERSIIGISGTTVTLDKPLDFRHFAGEVYPGVSLRAPVAHMSRNVVVRGDLTDSPPGKLTNWYEGYGGHIVVGEILWGSEAEIRAKRDAGEALGTVRKFGVLKAYNVQFADMGKLASEHPAIQIRYFNELPGDLAPAFDVSKQRSVVDGCAFLHSWNHGVRAEGSNALTIKDSTIYRGFKTQIEIWPDCSKTVINNNLIIAVMRSPDVHDPEKCARDNSCWVHQFSGVLAWTEDLVMKNNVIAGSDDTGFTFYPLDECGAGSHVIDNNEAIGTLIGHFALMSPGVSWDTAICREVSRPTAWKNAHVGVITVDQNLNLELKGAVLSDNHVGTQFMFVQDGILAHAGIRDSFIFGSTAASTCGRSVDCLAAAMGDERGLTCNSEWGSDWRRIGLAMPVYTNLIKTNGPAFYPPTEVFRMCSLPYTNRFGNVEIQYATYNVTGTTFAHWQEDDCGKISRAFSHNPSAPDFMSQTFFESNVWADDVLPGAMMQLGDKSRWIHEAAACASAGCDAVNTFSVMDLDGTTFGRFIDQYEETVATGSPAVWAISETNPTVTDPARCKPYSNFRSNLCLNTKKHRIVFEANPERFVARRLGPALLKSFPEGTTSEVVDEMSRVDFSVGPFPQGCSCQKHFAQFYFDVSADTHVDLYTSGIVEDRNRLSFFAPSEDECIVAEVHMSKPRPVKVSREDGTEIYPSLTQPTLSDPPGTNMLNPQTRKLYITMCGGGDPEYMLNYRNAIQVTAIMAVSIDTFFANDFAVEDQREKRLDTFVNNFLLLLGIDAGEVKVACVKGANPSGEIQCEGSCCSGSSRRFRRNDNDTVIDTNSTGAADSNMTLIIEISPPVSENVTTVFNGTVAVSTTSQAQTDWVNQNEQYLDELADNGTLAEYIENSTGYMLLALAVTVDRDADFASEDSSSSSPAAAIGAAVAVVALVAVIAAVVIHRKREEWKRAPRASTDTESQIPNGGTLSFIRGSVHGPGAGLANGASEYDERPSYFGTRNRAELQKDSLVVRKKKPVADVTQNSAFTSDDSYLDCAPDVRHSALQHTTPSTFTGAPSGTAALKPDETFRPRVDTQWEL